jgi:hypothetical protein
MNQIPESAQWQCKIPFAAKINRLGGAQGVPVKVVLLEEKGLLCRLRQTDFFKVGEIVELESKLPLINFNLKIKAKVIKTYDRVERVQDKEVLKSYITELHFLNFTQEVYSAFSQLKKAINLASIQTTK